MLPAILVIGLSFAGTQYFWSNHVDSNLVDLTSGIVSLVAALVFLRFWRPRNIWRFAREREPNEESPFAIKHTGAQIAKAWLPFAILSVFVLLWGLPAIKSAMGRATTPAFARGGWEWPMLHQAVRRAPPVVAQADSGGGAIRSELADGDRHGVLSGGAAERNRCWESRPGG